MATPLRSDQVQAIARLSRLKLTDAELAEFTLQLQQVLQYVEQLDEVDSTAVEPMVHAIELHNVLRADVLAPSLPRAAALANAPQTDGRCFLCPPILGEK
jgi:aspartyl-tRNA(Asn)/glutamyl-tRNA(Gln) amidotransferase subunit C